MLIFTYTYHIYLRNFLRKLKKKIEKNIIHIIKIYINQLELCSECDNYNNLFNIYNNPKIKLNSTYFSKYKNIIDWDNLVILKKNLFSEKFIIKYFDYFDLEYLVHNQKLSEELLIKYKDKLKERNMWNDIFIYQDVSSKFINKYITSNIIIINTMSKKVNLTEDDIIANIKNFGWIDILRTTKLSCNFLDKYNKYLDWNIVCEYQSLTEKFIYKYKNLINWEILSRTHKLSEKLLEDHINYLDWENISLNQKLSVDFIKKHIDKINIRLLYENSNLETIIEEIFCFYLETKGKINCCKKYICECLWCFYHFIDDENFEYSICNNKKLYKLSFTIKKKEYLIPDLSTICNFKKLRIIEKEEVIYNLISSHNFILPDTLLLKIKMDDYFWFDIKTDIIPNEVSENFIIKYKDYLGWDYISRKLILTENFISKYKYKLNWVKLMKKQHHLSENFLLKHKKFLVKDVKKYYFDMSFYDLGELIENFINMPKSVCKNFYDLN